MKFVFGDITATPVQQPPPDSSVHAIDVQSSDTDDCVAEVLLQPDQLRPILRGHNKHFYTRGAFDLIQLVLFILKQVGPSDVVISSYSIAEQTLKTIKRMCDKGEIRSIRFLIDNRVRSISPKPFNVLVTSFPDCYRCLALHAKVALISNDDWKITVVGSQNATHNPKLERGIIHTDPKIFDFDKMILDDEFNSGTT